MDASDRIAAPFHPGELRAQALAGGGPAGSAIRALMPEQHRTFFSAQRFLLVTAGDADGWPQAGILTGPVGFVGGPDPHTLCIDLRHTAGDALRPLLQRGRAMGVLGIDFFSRRRNRANGEIAAIDGSVLRMTVKQSFGNCPKYIRPRMLEDGIWAPSQAPSESFAGLDAEARLQLEAADTFFIASASGSGTEPDISHRAGPPGFIRVDGDLLTIPDFRGNRYFNTFGNLLQEPRAALLFIDFQTGGLLHLQGKAEILWQAAPADPVSATERWWRFRVERGQRLRGALPLRWNTLPAVTPPS